MGNKIAMIMPYFGKWPEWIDLFLYSCSRNPLITFMFFTDCGTPSKIYSNTIFHEISFADYCDRISKVLNIDFHPLGAYKLCDMKPYYGIVHAQELKGFDWWGYGDIDLVYGDMKPFLNKRLSGKYDILTTHIDRIAGHFTIIRKESKYNDLGLQLKGYRNFLEDKNKVYGIDESLFTQALMPWHMKMFNFIHGRILTHIFGTNKRHWFSYYWGKLTRLIPTRVYMQEYFTTFRPDINTCCTYDLASGKVYAPKKQQTWIVGG